eukprot:COSAG04_NODE_104_length_26097_cov_12.466074_19_plen_55_part_00
MKTYVVLFLGSVVGVYTSPVDAATVAKTLDKAVVVSCVLNGETETGKQLLASPA